jgi:diguanylate cyclase (GGDEF)-like protein
MVPFFGLASVTTGGLCIAASIWHARRETQRAEELVGNAAYREREMRFAAHALMAASRTSPQAVVDAITHAAQVLAPEIDSMLFAVPQGEVLYIEHAQGMHASYAIGARISLESDSPLAQAYRRGHRILMNEGSSFPMAIPGERATVAIPLIEFGRVIGVISLSSRISVSIDNIDAIVAVVDLAVAAYQISIDRKANIHSATVDELTGLLTPRAFREKLYAEVADVRMHRLPASLLFIDTDNFKACNDTYGHGAGDIVLSVIATLLKQEAGPDAIVGRNGGDEFCILLRSGKASALRRAEAIRRGVEDYRFDRHLGVVPQKPITLSIGLAGFPEDALEGAQLLERADAAMYHSKRSGRNVVSFFSGDRCPLTLVQASMPQ